MGLIDFFTAMWELAAAGKTQGIWFYAALYTLLMCLYSLQFQIRTRFWPSTEGVLKKLEAEKFGATDATTSSQDYTATALYTYQVCTEKYEGTRISPWIFVTSHNARIILRKQMESVQRLDDNTVKVFYNPRNPQKSYLIIAGKVGIGVTVIISLLPIVLFYVKYYA